LLNEYAIVNYAIFMRIMKVRTGKVKAARNCHRCGTWLGMICQWQLTLSRNSTPGRKSICMLVSLSCARRIT